MVGPFLKEDIEPFLALAKREGWICDRWELDFLLGNFPQGCLVRREQGRVVAFITSIGYESSGWIGNLLVHPDARKRGIGRDLMERSLCELFKSGVETIWLTASADGAGLYRKLGFVAIDRVNRWVGKGRLPKTVAPVPFDSPAVGELDRTGWGDRRESLLRVVCGRAQLYRSAAAFLCRQPSPDGMQVGPWSSLLDEQALQLFDDALAGAGERVFLDVPVGNGSAAALLGDRGFTVKGSSTLMYLGKAPLYRPQHIFALASMGSMG